MFNIEKYFLKYSKIFDLYQENSYKNNNKTKQISIYELIDNSVLTHINFLEKLYYDFFYLHK